ncbi:methyl-accepting chemotaxis protein [Marispirochaeta aestuarii]|uniref:methyl-accepting chemotaxis protein n=1 Tax=Marispirochaeta aestuarii TaxID=1963862 RepID=UPI002ABD9B4A|nr:methyl-accepting chemotaxis protein [Marispirochaeta aestuarii]
MDDFIDSKANRKIVLGYNKSVMLGEITERSMKIITEDIDAIRDSLGSIVTTFEEFRSTSQHVSENTSRIDQKMGEIIHETRRLDGELQSRVDEIVEVRSVSGEMQNLFDDVRKRTEAIKSITTSIQDVSEKTNVLAINASIEAARAGEFGKGFRVIAGEVRNLAGQTARFTREITDSLNEFSTFIGQMSDYVKRFTQVLGNFSTDISEVRQSFSETQAEEGKLAEAISEISAALEQESSALMDGTSTLESTFDSLKDSQVVVHSLVSTYKGLSRLMDKDQ